MSKKSIFFGSTLLLLLTCIMVHVPSAMAEVVPSDTAMFFDLPNCPQGWEEIPETKGLNIVGVNVGGISGSIVGTPLKAQEDRPTGKHGHDVVDPGHVHGTMALYDHQNDFLPLQARSAGVTTGSTDPAVTGISLGQAGEVPGTNAPYVQYLMCKVMTPEPSKSDEDKLPKGAVIFLEKSAQCPTGWTALEAGRGRIIVGLNEGGTLGAQIGQTLTDKENRPVGKHTHAVVDPGHSHFMPGVNLEGGKREFGGAPAAVSTSGTTSASAVTGIQVAQSEGPEGTNAPYIQMLMCEKQ